MNNMSDLIVFSADFIDDKINSHVYANFQSVVKYHNFIFAINYNKFKNDEFLKETNDSIFLIKGVIINKSSILPSNSSWDEFFIKQFESKQDEFIKSLRGSFSVIVFNKISKELKVYSDQIGSRAIYYSTFKSSILIVNNLYFGSKFIRSFTSFNLSLSEIGFNSFINYGFQLEDNTLINQFKKIIAGEVLNYNSDSFHLIKSLYHRFSNLANLNISENECIEEFDFLFRKAIKLQFEKNIEYGFNQVNTLSGGLDSRSVLFVAKDLGYSEILNLTWAQTESLDFSIAYKIAEDLMTEWLFKSLDNGLYLNQIDEITKINSGSALSYGHAHQNSIYKLIDKSKIGVIHTGQLGDVVFGTFFSTNNSNEQFKIGDGAYSRRFIHKLDNIVLKYSYPNQEIFNFYNRGFNGANSGLIIAQNYFESLSPFYDIDVLEFCLTIPLKFRFGHHIYKKWLIEKYPQAAKYKWEKINNLITTKPFNFFGKNIYLNNVDKHIINLISKKLYNKLYISNKFQSMNPLEVNYKNNILLKDYWDTYFFDNVKLLVKDKQDLLLELYTKGNAVEKNIAISLVSSNKLFFHAL